MLKKQSVLIAVVIIGSIGLLVLFLQLPKQSASAIEKASNAVVSDPDSLQSVAAEHC